MRIRTRVTIRNKNNKNFVVEEMKFINNVSREDLERIARACEVIIQETIMRKSKNPTGYLASFFTAEPILGGWGIGDLAELDSDVPYWNHIDKGSLGIDANWEHRLPKGRWVGGRWVIDDNGYFATPKSPIPAMNYIAETLAQMEILIPQLLKG